MSINWYNLNPIFNRVFPKTFTNGDEWIDLKDKNTGTPDGIRRSNEVIKPINDIGNEETDIDFEDIVSFLYNNISEIPEDKIQELIPLLIEYIRDNPMAGNYYEGESSFSAKETLAIIINNEPKYLSLVNEFLLDDNFLIRWAGIGILAMSENNKSLDMTEPLNWLTSLYDKEQSKIIVNEEPNIKTTYYQVNELYAEYLKELKMAIDYLKANYN